MSKRNKIIYWITTIFLGVTFMIQGVVQIMHIQAFIDMIHTHLGYPLYFLTIIGVWKILGAITLLLPGLARLKEWAYAGFVFVMSGAFISHLAVGDGFADLVPATVLLILLFISWYFRPADRKL